MEEVPRLTDLCVRVLARNLVHVESLASIPKEYTQRIFDEALVEVQREYSGRFVLASFFPRFNAFLSAPGLISSLEMARLQLRPGVPHGPVLSFMKRIMYAAGGPLDRLGMPGDSTWKMALELIEEFDCPKEFVVDVSSRPYDQENLAYGGPALEALSAKWNAIERLDIFCVTFGTLPPDTLAKTIGTRMSSLRSLKITGYHAGLNDAFVQRLVRTAPHLEELIVDGRHMTEDALYAFASATLTSTLKRLSLHHLTGASNFAFECLTSCTALEKLHLLLDRNQPRTEEPATWSLLAPRIVEACPNLVFLDLRGRDVSEETREYLKSKGLRGLWD